MAKAKVVDIVTVGEAEMHDIIRGGELKKPQLFLDRGYFDKKYSP